MMAAYNRFQHYKNNRSYNNVYYNEHGHFPREGGRQYEMDMGNVNSFGRGQDFNQGNISVVRDTGRNARPPPRPLMNPRVLNVDSHGNQSCMNMGLYPGTNMQEEYPMNFRMQNFSGQMNIPVNDIRSQNNICVGKSLWETQRYKFSEALSYIFSSPDDHLSNSQNHRQNLRRETYRKNCVKNNAIERRRFGNRIKMAANTSDEKSSVLFEQKTKNMPEKDTVVSKISNMATQLSALKVCGSGHETKSHEPNIDTGDSEGLQTKQDVPMTTNIEINEGLESPKTQSTPTVANGNQSPGSTQIVGSRNQSTGSTQTVASRNLSPGSTHTVASRNQSAESIQTVASRNQSAGSTQTVASRNRSAGSTQTVASRNQSAGSTQTVASRNQSPGSTQTVAGRNQSTGSIQTVASRSQSPGSTQTVASRNQSTGSIQTVASKSQSPGSTQTVASRNQSAGSTQTVASRNQSTGSTQTVASRNQSAGSTQTVTSRNQSPGSTQTVASRNQSTGSTQTVASRNQSAGSTQTVASRNQSTGSTQTVASRNQSAGSTQTVASRNQSTGSTQTVVSRNQSPGSTQTVASRNQSTGSTETVVSRNQSAGSTQTVASRNQSTGSTQTVASRNQSAGSTQTVASRNQSTGSTQTVASRNQSPGSTQTVASRNQSAGSTQTVASRNQSPGSTQTVASRNQSPGSTQTVASRNQSAGSTQTVASRNQSTGSTQTVASRNQSAGSTQTVASRNQSPGSTQTVASRNQSAGSTQTVASRNQSPGSTQTVASRNQSPGSTQTVTSRNQSPGSGKKGSSNKNLFTQTRDQHQEIVSSTNVTNSNDKNPSKELGLTPTKRKLGIDLDKNLDVVPSQSMEMDERHSRWSRRGDPADYSSVRSPSSRGNNETRHSDYSHTFINPPPIQDSGYGYGYRHPDSPRGVRETRTFDERDRYEGRWEGHRDNDGYSDYPPKGYGYGEGASMDWRQDHYRDDLNQYDDRWRSEQDRYDDRYYHEYGEGESRDWREDHYRDDLNQYEVRWRSEQDRYDDRYYPRRQEDNWYAEHDNRGRDYDNRDFEERNYDPILKEREQYRAEDRQRNTDNFNHGAYGNRKSDSPHARSHDQRRCDSPRTSRQDQVGGTNQLFSSRKREDQETLNEKWRLDSPRVSHQDQRKSDSPHALHQNKRKSDSPSASLQKGDNNRSPSLEKRNQEIRNEIWRSDSPRKSLQEQVRGVSYYNSRGRNQGMDIDKRRSDSPLRSSKDEKRPINSSSSRERCDRKMHKEKRSDSPCTSSDEKSGKYSSNSRERRDREMRNEKRSDSPRTSGDEKSGKNSSNSRERRDQEMRNEKRSDSPCTSGDEKSGKYSSNSRESHDREKSNEKRSEFPHASSEDEKRAINSSNSCERRDQEMPNQKRSYSPRASSVEKRAINSSNSRERRDQEMHNQKRSDSPRASSVEKRAINSSNSCERHDRDMRNAQRISDSPRRSRQDQKEASVEKKQCNDSSTNKRKEMTPDKRLVPKNEPKEQTIHTGSKNVDTMDLKNERYIQTKIKSLTVTKEAQSNVAGESPSKKTEARIKQTQANQSYESSNSSKIIGNSKTWKSEQSFDKRVSTTPMANLYGTDPVIQGDSYNSKHGSSADNTYRHRHGSGAESDRHAGYSHGRSRHNSRGSIPSHSGRHGGVTKQRSAESTSQSNDGNSLPEIRLSGRNSSHFRRDCSFRTISSEEDNQGGSDLDIDIDDSDDELEMPFFLTSLTEASSRPIPSTPTKNVTGGVHTDSPVPGGSPQYSGVSADYEAKSSFFSLESLLKETTEKSDKQREFEEIQAELKAGIRRGGFVKDTLEKEEGDDSTVPEELLPEHQVRLKHFHVSKSVMSDTHPGEEIFDPHRFQRLFTSSVTPTNCGLTPGPGLLDRHLSTLQPENFMLLLTSDMMLNFDRLSCPNAVLCWLLFIMSTHKSHLVLNGCLKIIEDHLHTEKHFGNTSKTTWSPAVDDVLSILCNFGAEPSDLLPRTALHTDGDIFREVQVIEVRDNAHNEQGGRYNRENLRLVLHTLAIAFQTRPRYTGQELTQLLIMLCRAALDKSLCNNMLTYEFQLVIASILKLYCETDWNTQSPSLCRMLSSLTSHHHNRVYLCQLLPPTTRGSYLQRRVSYLQLQNLFFPERNMSDNQIHNFEIKKLHSLLPVLQGLSVTDVYKLASAVSLLEMCVGNGLIKSSEKDDIEYLTEQMKKITGDVRDNVQHLDRTRVKDMMIRITSKWSLALLSVGTKQATLFSYTKRKSPPKMTIETVSASQSDNEDQSSQSEAEEDDFIPEEEENNSALHKKISSLKQSTISDFVKETDCLSSKEIKKEKIDSSYNDKDSIANRDQKSICYESLMNVDTSDEEIDLTELDDDDLPEL